ncbi:MAG: Na+/H+ antiporter NhaC family protein [Pseudomonadota bacterium]
MQSVAASLSRRLAVAGAVMLVMLVMVWLAPQGAQTYGVWSLTPAFVTILLCFVTRNVILALLAGVLSGGLISGQYNLIDAYFVPSLATQNYAQILFVYLWCLGGLIGIWNRTGGAVYFAQSAADRFVRGPRQAKLFAWFLGLVFHQGGTISTVLAGTTVRPVADQHRVSHEELSYVVDSTASPIATLIPFNVWPIYVAGLLMIDSLTAHIPDEEAALGLFFQAIPFNFYAMFAVTMTLLLSLDKLPLFKSAMAAARRRARETGALDAPDAEPMLSRELTEIAGTDDYTPSMWDFFVPMLTLMGFCAVPWLMGGSPWVFEGFGMAVVSAIGVTVFRGLSIKDAFDAVLTGIKGVTVGAIILGLAVTLANVSQSLGTADYVIAATVDHLDGIAFLLPALLMLVSMIVAFSIGSSWGTYAVMFPLALPLAFAINPDGIFVLLCFGALLGGAVFGDQCSPISDTTILSALACGADLMAHVKTQLPLALTAAGAAGTLYTLLSAFTI